MSERPSQQKAMGVSNKFLAYSERQMALTADWIRFNEEDLRVTEAMRISYTFGFGVMRNLFETPFQTKRVNFLLHAREIEGLKPGEEAIATFALNHCKQPTRYPMIRKQAQNPLQ